MDWLVASGVFVHKPVVLWKSSPHTSIALAALREILIVISARLVNEAGLEVLIKSTGAADPPVNSDPVAVQTAPLALQSALTLREHSPDSNCQPSTHSLIATPATLIRPPNGNAAA